MRQAWLQELQFELYLRMRENSEIVWRTKNGENIPINQMSNEHLVNAIKMIERQEEFLDVHSDLIGLDLNDIC